MSEICEIKTIDHVCNETKLKDITKFINNIKFCPVCHTLCEKTGCDQVFCLHCKTLFNWKTLKIETGKIHNVTALKHFGLNEKRDIDDIPCGGVIPYSQFFSMLQYCNSVGPYFYFIFISAKGALNRIKNLTFLTKNNKKEFKQKLIITEYMFEKKSKKETLHLLCKKEKEFILKKKEIEILTLYLHLLIERLRDLQITLYNLISNNFHMFLFNVNFVMENFFSEMNLIRLMINEEIQEQKRLSGQKSCFILDAFFEFKQINNNNITKNEKKLENNIMWLKYKINVGI